VDAGHVASKFTIIIYNKLLVMNTPLRVATQYKSTKKIPRKIFHEQLEYSSYNCPSNHLLEILSYLKQPEEKMPNIPTHEQRHGWQISDSLRTEVPCPKQRPGSAGDPAAIAALQHRRAAAAAARCPLQ